VGDERAGEIERGRLMAPGQASTSRRNEIGSHDRIVEDEVIGELVDQVDVVLVDRFHSSKVSDCDRSRFSPTVAFEEFERRLRQKRP
jgi:hypothetical protein